MICFEVASGIIHNVWGSYFAFRHYAEIFCAYLMQFN
jgi:hypothetical protein